MSLVLHITNQHAWADALRAGSYAPPSLAREGFIHCSTLPQLVDTANAFYRGQTDLVLLLIDAALAKAELRYEPPVGAVRAESAGLFPHLYGPLNLDAVARVLDFPPLADGSFALPAGVHAADSAAQPAGAADPRAQLLAEIESEVGALPDALRRALRSVDRSAFVREIDRAHAWQNLPLPLDARGPEVASVDALTARYGSYRAAIFHGGFKHVLATISAPGIYALMYRLLGLRAGQRLLELGTGTGYGAALAAEVVGPSGHVTTLEVDPVVVGAARARLAGRPNITLLHDDGLLRPDLVASHDRVAVTFSVERVPDALLEALPEAALLLAPVGPALRGFAPLLMEPNSSASALDPGALIAKLQAAGAGQMLTRFQRQEGQLRSEALAPVMFVAARPFIA